MTLTTAIILNVILVTGIVVALARLIHLPFRIEQHRELEHAVYVPGENELSRAA